ncbi:trypsin-like peptidase domain-containing protein [Alisedimentitalea sp. MJ-SS2]|uniref:trypsin-like peptidase domain-containing protein n=1 Tax=Aliisedimentitalea sp. MJ-SS2 TaxID=3049795 RepID=UPI00290C99AD|nr:trypsin-like peptidase domain-containing protein [Alisedimentitalea sp. MJ-SS2]MDU8929919.1 trypsin-like peptidase domain-containing protein [Alisedimentitalea sp. MJ-SS2]
MTLTSEQKRNLFNALLDAYPDRDDLKITLSIFCERNYADLTPVSTRRSEYATIMQKSVAQGWAHELVRVAHEEIPDNPLLAALAQDLAIARPSKTARPAAAVSPEHEQTADHADSAAHDALQRLVNPSDPSVGAEILLKRLSELGARTGALEIGGMHQGTCFLVAPDIVLTNHHVVKPLFNLDPHGADVRFDFFTDANAVVQNGWTVELAEAWHIHSRPHGAADTSHNPDDVPAADELDYALVRLAEPVDDRPCPTLPAQAARGFQRLQDTGPAAKVGNHITITQHPAGAPRHLAFGGVLSLGGENRRVRYSANTKKGSSGSPVTDGRGKLIALHHAGDPNFSHLAEYNQGVPVSLILDDIQAAGKMAELPA